MDISNKFLNITSKINSKTINNVVDTNVQASIADLNNNLVSEKTSNDSININGVNKDIIGCVSDEKLENIYSNQKVLTTYAVNNQTYKLVAVPQDQEVMGAVVATTVTYTGTKFTNDELSAIKKAIWEHQKTRTSGNADGDIDGDGDTDEGGDTEPTNPTDPSEEDEDGDETEGTPTSVNYTLTRKSSSNSKSFTATSTEKTVKLTNSITGEDCYYYISAYGSTSSSVSLEYLDNDRLIITGNNIKVVAAEGQEDNLIVIGSSNYVDTNTGNDTIRVGVVIDSYYSVTDENKNVTEYGIVNTRSDNNTIKSGDGDDYVLIYGTNNATTMGAGTDTLKYVGATVSNMEGNLGNTSSGIETKLSQNGKTSSSNGVISGGGQGEYGDCKLLSFIASLIEKNDLSKYVNITKNGSNYTVTFTLSNKSTIVTAAQLSAGEEDDDPATRSANGDLDLAITELAFNNIINSMGYNMEEVDDENDVTQVAKVLGVDVNSYLISNVFFGDKYDNNGAYLKSNWDIANFDNEKWYDWYIKDKETGNLTSECTKIIQEYLDGTVTNLVLEDVQIPEGQESEFAKLGLVAGHAYAVVGGEFGSYIELRNPWDFNDTIKLDWNDIVKYFSTVLVSGDTFDEFQKINSHISNDAYAAASTNLTTSSNDITSNIKSLISEYNKEKQNSFDLYS